jgi:hypothetical protein
MDFGHRVRGYCGGDIAGNCQMRAKAWEYAFADGLPYKLQKNQGGPRVFTAWQLICRDRLWFLVADLDGAALP